MKRPLKNRVGKLLPCMYEILLLVENDENDYRKGCNWTFVKSNLKSLKFIDQKVKNTKIIVIKDNDFELKLKTSGYIASSFLIKSRDCFAHNRMEYNSNLDIIKFEMNEFEGSIPANSYKEIINKIKESKDYKNTLTQK